VKIRLATKINQAAENGGGFGAGLLSVAQPAKASMTAKLAKLEMAATSGKTQPEAKWQKRENWRRERRPAAAAARAAMYLEESINIS